MKLVSIESTDQIDVRLGRVWKAFTESGVELILFVSAVGVRDGMDVPPEVHRDLLEISLNQGHGRLLAYEPDPEPAGPKDVN